MAGFNRFDETRSSYHFEKRGSKTNFISPLSSPLFRRKMFAANGGGQSGPSSLASSRESSLDRTDIMDPLDPDNRPLRAGGTTTGRPPTGQVPYGGIHSVVAKVTSSPKMTLKQRFQVMRSGSFNDVQGAKSTLEAKRKRWLDRSGSLRLTKTKSLNPSTNVSNGSINQSPVPGPGPQSPWSSPEYERRGGGGVVGPLVRNRSVDRALGTTADHSIDPDDPGKVKGFVNR